jgi:hypothetical protein
MIKNPDIFPIPDPQHCLDSFITEKSKLNSKPEICGTL